MRSKIPGLNKEASLRVEESRMEVQGARRGCLRGDLPATSVTIVKARITLVHLVSSVLPPAHWSWWQRGRAGLASGATREDLCLQCHC